MSLTWHVTIFYCIIVNQAKGSSLMRLAGDPSTWRRALLELVTHFLFMYFNVNCLFCIPILVLFHVPIPLSFLSSCPLVISILLSVCHFCPLVLLSILSSCPFHTPICPFCPHVHLYGQVNGMDTRASGQNGQEDRNDMYMYPLDLSHNPKLVGVLTP